MSGIGRIVGVNRSAHNRLYNRFSKKGRGAWGLPGDHVLGDREERSELGVGVGNGIG